MCRWRWSASRGNTWMFIKSGRHRRLASMVCHVWPILRTCRRCSGVAAALARASCRRVGIPLRAALAPAPRRALPPDTPGRRDGLGSRGGNPNRLAPAPAALPRTRSLRPQALCRLPVTTVRPAGAQRRAANGPRAPRAEHRAALRPTTLSLPECGRAKSCCSTCSRQRDAIAGRCGAPPRQVVRPTGCGVSGRLRGLPTGRHPEGLQRQELLLPMQQRRTRSALHHANSPRSAPGVRPVVARLPASPTARRRPARRRNPPRRQRGLKGHRRRRTGHRRRRARRLGRRDRRRR